ncbi:glycosyltransferase [Aeromonas dhakensis]|uniref:glycosyltransferase n=1 Tax=Aeromonas dhakensis TaxID=196024 RepID=UPI0039886B82
MIGKVVFVNISSVYGGQERYAKSIISFFNNRCVDVDFIGGPDILKQMACFSRTKTNFSISILNGNSALYKYIFSSLPGKFNVYVQHSDINDGQQPRWRCWIRKALLKVLLRRINLVVRVCEKALPDSYAPGKIITIHNGVSLPSITFTSKNFNQGYRLLMVGAFTKNKNQCMAIEALKLLPQATLTLVGDGPEREKLKLLASSLNVQDRVIFTGFVTDPSKYYQTHDLLLMLSQFEAFPYVVLEAMAAYCPVLATKVGGVPEAIVHNHNGWLLNGSSSQELADRVAAIYQDSDKYNDIAIQARKTIESRFTEEGMVDRLLAEIEKRLK